MPEVRTRCKRCGSQFSYITDYPGNKRQHCSNGCRELATKAAARRYYLRKKGSNEDEIRAEMIRWENAHGKRTVAGLKSVENEEEHGEVRCAWKDCTTILSSYNPGPYCYRHSDEEVTRNLARLAQRQPQAPQQRILAS